METPEVRSLGTFDTGLFNLRGGCNTNDKSITTEQGNWP